MNIERYALGLAALLLVGCGGGGGGDDGNNNNPPPPPPAETGINSDNVMQVAGATVNTTQLILELGLTSLGGVLLPVPAIITPPAGAHPIGGALRYAMDLRSNPDAVTEDTFLCSLGGIVEVTADVAVDGTLSAGDTVTAVFNSCEEASGTTDGAADAIVNAVTGDITAPPFTLDMSVTLDAFTMTTESETSIGAGTFDAGLSSQTTDDVLIVLAGSELTTTVNDVVSTIQNYSVATAYDLVAALYTIDSSGTLDDDLGTFEFTTPTVFAAVGDEFPNSGEMLVTAADDSNVRLIALDNVNVRLELDTDGDGEADETSDTTWDELLAQ